MTPPVAPLALLRSHARAHSQPVADHTGIPPCGRNPDAYGFQSHTGIPRLPITAP